MAEQRGKRVTEDEIHRADNDPCFENLGRGRCHLCGKEGQLLNRDQRDNRRILDQGDELTRKRWQNFAYRLRKNDVAQNVKWRQANGARRLPLTLWDGLNAGPHDLGDIRALK